MPSGGLSMRSILYPLTAAVLWVASACQAARHDASGPLSLAEAGPAQAEFRALRARFFDADAPGRAALTDALGDFLTRFPDDPRTLDVRVYLVWARLGAGDPAGAR